MPCAPAVSALVVCAAALGACGSPGRSGAVDGLPTTSAQAPASSVEGRDADAPSARTAPAAAAPAASAATGATGAAHPANPGGASADGAGQAEAGTTPGGASGTPGVAGDQPGGQSARFTIGAADVRPASVRVAPSRALTLAITNADPAGHRVKLVGTDVAFVVAPGVTELRSLPGLKAGMYTVSVDGGRAAAGLVVGDEAAG